MTLGAAALALGAVAAPASAAQAAESAITSMPGWCSRGQLWDTDGRSVGVRCDVGFSYYARVRCTNGSATKTARGVGTNDNRWSYAYCTSHGPRYRVVPGTATVVRA